MNEEHSASGEYLAALQRPLQALRRHQPGYLREINSPLVERLHVSPFPSHCNSRPETPAMDQAPANEVVVDKKRKCEGVDCGNDASTLQCPKCQKLGQESYFCSQDCFKKNWVSSVCLAKRTRRWLILIRAPGNTQSGAQVIQQYALLHPSNRTDSRV